MRRSLKILIWGLSFLGLGLQDPAGEPLPFEGALVVEAPSGLGGPAPGDILLTLNGRAPGSLPRLRRALGESLGEPAKARVSREGRQIDLEWTPLPGTYRLTDWPSPAELFRRAHAADQALPAFEAARAAIQAASEGKARSATRLLERARTLGMNDPWLDWAEATLKLRYLSLPLEAAQALGRAESGLEHPSGAADRRRQGLCRIAAGFRELLHGSNPVQAYHLYEAARATGVDASELARAVAAALPRDSEYLRTLRHEAFLDDPLDRETAEWLSRQVGAPEEIARYADWAERLSGSRRSDPLLVLAGLLGRVGSEPQAREALSKFLASHPKLEPEDRARGLDALAGAWQRSGDSEQAFELRREALEASPTLARARAAACGARRLGRYAPVLELLRKLAAPPGAVFLQRAYLEEYADLSADELVWEGSALLDEAARLAREGRAEEAADLLKDKARAYAQPEFTVTAGVLRSQAGLEVDPKEYFEDEARFWGKASEQDAASGFRHALLVARSGRSGLDRGSLDWDRVLRGHSPALAHALMAAVAAGEKQPSIAEARLAEAWGELGADDTVPEWIPVYAAGRVCRTLREWMAALALEHHVKLPGLAPVPAAPAAAFGPPARADGRGAPVSLTQLLDRSERVLAGTVEVPPAGSLAFRFRGVRALKGTAPPAEWDINGATAQDWHPAAIEAGLKPGAPAVLFQGPSGEALLYLDRMFVRLEADPRGPAAGSGWSASRLELAMTRTFDGPAAELAGRLEAASREPLPAPQPERPALTRERLGIRTPERGPLSGEYAPDREGFIRHWLVLGPIELGERASEHTAQAQGEFFDREWFPGQRTARPEAGDTMALEKGDLEWEPRRARGFVLDLGQTDNSLSLGIVYLYCDRELPGIVLAIGSDDGSRWSLNGEELIRVHVGRGVDRDQDRSKPVVLRAGLNVLSMAVINGISPTGACARFLDASGAPVRGFVCRLSPRR